MLDGIKRLFCKHDPLPSDSSGSTGGEPVYDGRTPSASNKLNGQAGLPPDEKLVRLVEKSLEVMREHGLDEVGKAGYFVAFDVPDTNHEGVLRVTREGHPGQEHWLLSIGVHENGSSRLHSHFLCHGDGQEGKDKIVAYLSRPEIKMELVASVKELSGHVDRDD